MITFCQRPRDLPQDFACSRPTNCLAIDITSTGFDVRALLPTNNTPPIEFINGDQAIIKVMTLDSRLITNVSLQTERNVALHPSALEFGDNFFQVNLADAGPINVGALATFSVTYGLSQRPVPEPSSLALLGVGLAGFVIMLRCGPRRLLRGVGRFVLGSHRLFVAGAPPPPHENDLG